MNNLSQQLFNRAWALEIGDPQNPGAGKLYASSVTAPLPMAVPGKKGQSSVVTADGKPPTGLRTVFEIDKTSVSTSNKAKITVYNFSQLSRLNYKKGYQVHLRAGYVGLVSTIYIGDIPEGPKGCITTRNGADVVTVFECGAAEKQLVYAHYDESYPPGTFTVDVLNDLADQLEVSLGTVSGVVNLRYNSGLSLSGSIKSSLDMLTKKQGLEWNIENGELRIYPIGRGVGTAIVLSKSTGLIGIPSEGAQFTVFEALLNPRLVPGSIVQIKAETVNGFFKIRRATFEGDSWGEKWQVKCECLQISATSGLAEQNFNGRIIA